MKKLLLLFIISIVMPGCVITEYSSPSRTNFANDIFLDVSRNLSYTLNFLYLAQRADEWDNAVDDTTASNIEDRYFSSLKISKVDGNTIKLKDFNLNTLTLSYDKPLNQVGSKYICNNTVDTIAIECTKPNTWVVSNNNSGIKFTVFSPAKYDSSIVYSLTGKSSYHKYHYDDSIWFNISAPLECSVSGRIESLYYKIPLHTTSGKLTYNLSRQDGNIVAIINNTNSYTISYRGFTESYEIW